MAMNMSDRNLDAIFAPQSIAVVGVSDRVGSVGGAVFANLRRSGFPGPVYAVNHQHSTVLGERAYPSIRQLPSVPDLAVICTAAAGIPELVRDCGDAGVRGLIVISAGFREIGPTGRVLENRLKSILSEFPDLRMIGPNCLGVLCPTRKMNASFSPVLPAPGRMTLLTQSGALATAIMDWSVDRGIGFATCVSVGNMTNVGMGQLIDYFGEDNQTDALLLYLEGLDESSHFISASQKCSRHKPIIAFKSGRFEESSRAIASHTGAMVSQDAAYDAAFRRAGIERVHSIEELFDCANLLSGPRRAVGNRLAIVTNAGGAGIMACDAWLALNGSLAEIDNQTRAELDQALPTCWSHGNPIDVLGDATSDRFRIAIQSAQKDPNVDCLMVIVTPQTMTEPDRIAETLVAAQRLSPKAIVACWIGGGTVQKGREILRASGVPVYDFPEAAAGALHHLVSSGSRLTTISTRPTTPDISLSPPPTHVDHLRGWLSDKSGLIDQLHCRNILSAYGVPVVSTQVAKSADDAAALASNMGYPVVLKVMSPDISHKTDVGGVRLGLANADQVKAAYAAISESVRERAPSARWEGVSVQSMVSAARGVELLLGMKRDPIFGPVILLGAGGITAELQKDTVLELSPLDETTLEQMLRSLRLYPLLTGYRGRPGVDLNALRRAVMAFTQMTLDLPGLISAEVNPLLATAEGVTALDIRMIAG